MEVECQEERTGSRHTMYEASISLNASKQMLSKQTVVLTIAGGCMWNLLENRRAIWRR